MNPDSLFQLLPGPFNFLRPDGEEVRRLFPDLEKTVPSPRPVFLEDESATPLRGFPVLLSDGMKALRDSLRQYLLSEEAMQVSILRRESYDRKLQQTSWERYRGLFCRAVENATISSYGRQYPGVFWLHHSLEVARTLKETPKRILRADLEIGRRYGDQIKYRVFDRYLDRVLATTYDLVQKMAGATEEGEEELFPRLLSVMRDNVLIFTEDHISRDLAELVSYFSGYLRIDGRDLRARLEEVSRWHAEQLAGDPELAQTVTHLLGADPRFGGRDLLNRGGYLSFLASRRGYNPARLLPPPLVQVWESLLVKLKEFEIFHGIRRLLVVVERQEDRLICRAASSGTGIISASGAGGLSPLRLSATTRPLDFLQPWVVDPRVERFGLIYDIREFSQTVSVLDRAGQESQEEAFRMMFRFQRRVNRIARTHRTQMEKYLGDGAFYSSREALRPLVCAVLVQRYYQQMLAEGFPFSRGLRLALNFGSYRLIPMGGGGAAGGERYEFFGQGLVELSRLVSGKATREIEDVKNMLLNQGYPEATVRRFFAPLTQRNVDLVDKQLDSRPFHAYVDGNGNLINNGLVATGAYVDRLEQELTSDALFLTEYQGLPYLVLDVDDAGERLQVGMRRLGIAKLKGLEELAVYEIIDAGQLSRIPLGGRRAQGGLVRVIDREFNQNQTVQRPLRSS